MTIARSLGWCAVHIVLLTLLGCAGAFVNSDATHRPLSLDESSLQQGGLALLTPSTVTGREEDKQALALAFYTVLSEQRTDLQVYSLAHTLSTINSADLMEQYERMFLEEARDTGIFDRAILQKVSRVTGARYLAQLKLAGFRQESLSRWSFFGVRLVQTKRASMRMFMQIWDSRDGTIVWEGSVETVQAMDTSSEHEVTLREITKSATLELIKGLPGAEPVLEPPSAAFYEADGEPSR